MLVTSQHHHDMPSCDLVWFLRSVADPFHVSERHCPLHENKKKIEDEDVSALCKQRLGAINVRVSVMDCGGGSEMFTASWWAPSVRGILLISRTLLCRVPVRFTRASEAVKVISIPSRVSVRVALGGAVVSVKLCTCLHISSFYPPRPPGSSHIRLISVLRTYRWILKLLLTQ